MGNISANLAAVSGTAKASSGQLFAIIAGNRNAAIRHLMIFDSASAPVTGAAPIFQIQVPATGTISLGPSFFAPGWSFANGITWGFSTTPSVYAAATASDHDFLAVYA